MMHNLKKFVTMGLISSVLFSTDCYGNEIEGLLSSSNCSYPVTEGLSGFYSGVTVNENGSIQYSYSNNNNSDEVKESKIDDKDYTYLSSPVKSAVVNNSKEIRESIERKITEDLYMTIVKDIIDGNDVYISHLVVNNPEQMEKLVANGGYNRGTETVSSMAAKAGVVWACNGSHFDLSNHSTQDYRNNNIAIVNGKIVHDGGRSVGHEICYSKEGRWFTAPKGASAQDLLNMGVIETYSSLQMPILENGCVSKATDWAESRELAKSYNRTVIGQTDNGEIFVLTGYTTTKSAAEYLRNKGCKWAKSMDMGGSVTLYANGKVINDPTDKNGERAVIDGIGVLK